MSDATDVPRTLRERLGGSTEERLGRALSELLDNPLLTGAIGRALDAREKAVQAQEVAMGAFNIPSAADVERLTRRLRSVSLRLEGIEESLERLDRAFGRGGSPTEALSRLEAIEQHLARISERLEQGAPAQAPSRARPASKRAGGSGGP